MTALALAPDGGVLVSATTRRATVGSIRYGESPRLVDSEAVRMV